MEYEIDGIMGGIDMLSFNNKESVRKLTAEVREKSEKLAPLLNEIKAIQEKIDERNKNDDAMFKKNFKGAKEVITIYRELKEIKKSVEDVCETAIGQMYKGTLIDGQLSVRNGGCYIYRCQSEYRAERLISILKENLEEVKKKLNPTYFNILEKIIKFFDSEVNSGGRVRRSYKELLTKIEIPNETYLSIDYSGRNQLKTISALIIDSCCEISGEEVNGNYLDGDVEDVVIDNHRKLIEEKFKELKKILSEELTEKTTELDNIREITQKLCMFAKLKDTTQF